MADLNGQARSTVTRVAGGTINCRRFVAATATAFGVVQAVAITAAQYVVGISQDYDRARATNPAGSSAGVAATVGEDLQIHTAGAEAMLELGTGGATVGDGLVPDVNGKGVVASTNAGATHNAYALETGIAGDYIRVWVVGQGGRAIA